MSSAMASEEIPERPKHENTEGEGGKLSKNALKKAQKEKEKAEKAAKRKEQEQQERAKAEASDTAKGLYGNLPKDVDPKIASPIPIDRLASVEPDSVVTLQARVHNARVQSAKLAFLVLRQRFDTIQAVVAEGGDGQGVSRQMVKWAGGINSESVVRVTGVVRPPKDPVHSTTLSNLELHIERIYMISEAAQQLPMQVKDAMRAPPEASGAEEGQVDAEGAPVVTLHTRLNNRLLDLRTPSNHAIFAVNSGVVDLFCRYMRQHGSTQVQTPKMLGAATEGGSGVFTVGYFDTKAYLAQSPQLHKQMCIAGDMRSVFEVGPVFRAENSNTHRHMTEFTGLDFEMEFQNHYHEVLGFAEDLIVYLVRGLQKEYSKEIALIQREYPTAGDFKLPDDGKALRLRFADGVKMLKDAGIEQGELEDLSTANEKQLGKLIKEKYGTDFYVLDKFPLVARPFYTMPCPEDPQLSNSYDFFMRGEEILSGAQRVHDAKLLVERMKANDPPLIPDSEGFKDYVNAFRFGCPPHAGVGMGLNRITQFFLGLPNIRMATLFPRDPQRLRP